MVFLLQGIRQKQASSARSSTKKAIIPVLEPTTGNIALANVNGQMTVKTVSLLHGNGKTGLAGYKRLNRHHRSSGISKDIRVLFGAL